MAPMVTSEQCQITVTHVKQAGSTFLLSYNCPSCNEPELGTYPFKKCTSCGADLTTCFAMLPTDRRHFTLLTGTFRKRKGGMSKKKIKLLLELQEFTCAYCSCCLRAPGFEVEHVLPVAVGGTNNISNLVLSCKLCNLIGGARAFKSLSDKREYIILRRNTLKIKT